MKNNFISAKLFAKKYGVSLDNIHVYKSNHRYKNNGIKQLNSRKLLVDETYFIRRKEFRNKIKIMAQENYYFLTSSISSFQLAKLLSKYTGANIQSWVTFMHISLFAVDDTSILYMNSFKKLWQFFRLTRALIRVVFKKVGVPANKRDYNKMYDYKYGRVA